MIYHWLAGWVLLAPSTTLGSDFLRSLGIRVGPRLQNMKDGLSYNISLKDSVIEKAMINSTRLFFSG